MKVKKGNEKVRKGIKERDARKLKRERKVKNGKTQVEVKRNG